MATATDTLVVLMASGKLAETCATLIDAGRPVSTPAAIVQWAWTEDQRVVTGSLAELPTLAAGANIGPPATLVVGEVVAVGDRHADAAVHGRSAAGAGSSQA
jgi:siroheme synthase